MRRRAVLCLLAIPVAVELTLVLASCSGSLPPASRVDKLRVLAVRAEPPEVMPGQASTLDTLTALPPLDPGATPPSVSYLWLACRQPAGATAPQPCGVTSENPLPDGGLARSDGGGAQPSSLPRCADQPDASLCLIGEDPRVTYAPSAAALGGGNLTQVILTVAVADATSGGAAACVEGALHNGGAPVDPDHCVIALKRLTVSRSDHPNHNPTLDALTLGDASLADGSARFTVAGPHADLAAVRTPGTAELKPDGSRESLFISWFVTAGAVDNSRTTFYPAGCDAACSMRMDAPSSTGTRWTPPTAGEAATFVHAGQVKFFAVVHDDRDGEGWLEGKALAR